MIHAYYTHRGTGITQYTVSKTFSKTFIDLPFGGRLIFIKASEIASDVTNVALLDVQMNVTGRQH